MIAEIKLNRRPVKLRDNHWVKTIALWLARRGMEPNQISILSVVCSAISGACLMFAATSSAWQSTALYLGAALFIALRGICNLCDGLVAVEGGLKTNSGEIFNDLPDRISDPILLVATGYSIIGFSWGHELGWAAALLAVITAYVRVLGGAAGAAQQFCGPMSKSQRMFLVMAACLIAGAEAALGRTPRAMILTLAMIIVGSTITTFRRAHRIVKELESK